MTSQPTTIIGKSQFFIGGLSEREQLQYSDSEEAVARTKGTFAVEKILSRTWPVYVNYLTITGQKLLSVTITANDLVIYRREIVEVIGEDDAAGNDVAMETHLPVCLLPSACMYSDIKITITSGAAGVVSWTYHYSELEENEREWLVKNPVYFLADGRLCQYSAGVLVQAMSV